MAKKMAMIQANERRYLLDGKNKGGGREGGRILMLIGDDIDFDVELVFLAVVEMNGVKMETCC